MHRDRLDRLEAEFEAANVRIGEATWSVYSGEGTPDLDGAHQQLAGLLTDASNRQLVEEMYARADSIRDRLLARRLSIWSNCFTSAQVDNAPEIFTLKNRLQQRIAAFQFELEGHLIRRSELQKVLRQEPDRERRHRAWQATAALAAANREDLRRLIALRNQKSRELGYRDYVDLALQLQEMDEHWLLSLLDRVTRAIRPLYSALVAALAERLGVRSLAPWDVHYAMRQGYQLPDDYFPGEKALERLYATARAFGFAVDSLPIRTLVRDIPFGGYNVAVRIPSDTRFLVNPSEGQSFHATTFHEYGHSLQAVFTAVEWPILKEYEWVMGAHTGAYSEGMAEVIGDFTRRADWLRRVAEVPDQDIEQYISRMLPAQMALRFHDLLLNFRVELAAYSESVEDTGVLERRLTREIRLIEFPEADAPLWEANTWYTSYPIYWQNYILASIVAAQIHDSITERCGRDVCGNPAVAEYLRHAFYAHGNSIPWHERILRGTGHPLDADAYLRLIVVGDRDQGIVS